MYTDLRDKEAIIKNKEKYYFYLSNQISKPVFITSKGDKITFLKIQKNSDGVKALIKNLPEEEQRRAMEEVLLKTQEHIREGEKYGFKYYEQRV